MRKVISDGLIFGVFPAAFVLGFGRACYQHDTASMWVFGVLSVVTVISIGILSAVVGAVIHEASEIIRNGRSAS